MNQEIIRNIIISILFVIVLVLIYILIPKNKSKSEIPLSLNKKNKVKHQEIKCPRCDNKYLDCYRYCLVCGEENPNHVNVQSQKYVTKDKIQVNPYVIVTMISIIIVIFSYILAINL